MNIRRVSRSIKKRGFLGFVRSLMIDALEFSRKKLDALRDNYTRYRFIDRSKKKDRLIVVLAGYKSYLWPSTFVRLEKYAPADADVCVASPGKYSGELEAICQKNQWSYLYVSRNSPGVALNKALQLHAAADYIYKLDEDILVGKNFFQSLYEGYHYAWKKSLLEPGFCAPVLNINGISYIHLLELLSIEEDYKKKFGPLFVRCGDLPVHADPEAAYWLWKQSLPFDKTSEIFSSTPVSYTACNTRFSIGAILFRRNFIYSIGGFKSSWSPGVLGVDEDFLCRDCVAFSRPMFIIKNVFAGHFSFGPQEVFMKDKLSDLSLADPGAFL